MIVIGFTGKKRSGKSTAAEVLRDEFGFRIMGFADPLKEMALAIDPLITLNHRLSDIIEDMGWEWAKDEYPEIRRFLQKLGTEGVRGVLGEDIWVEHMADRLYDIKSVFPDARVAIPDVRFDNEASLINNRMSWKGAVIEINRHQLEGNAETDPVGTIRDTGNRSSFAEADPLAHVNRYFIKWSPSFDKDEEAPWVALNHEAGLQRMPNELMDSYPIVTPGEAARRFDPHPSESGIQVADYMIENFDGSVAAFREDIKTTLERCFDL